MSESKVLYLNEHLNCYAYEKKDNPLIGKVSIARGKANHFSFLESSILCVTKGKLFFSFGEVNDRIASNGKLILLPPGCNFYCTAMEQTSLIVFRLRNMISLCDRFPIDNLWLGNEDYEYEFSMLTFNDRMSAFLKNLSDYLDDGLHCHCLLEMKSRELFFILRGYYRKEELLGIFYPLLQGNVDFSNFIFQNYQKVSSVKELAEMSNYSLSGLEKRFKKVFGVSVYQWIKEQRIKNIFREIHCTDKSFKELTYQHGFSSPSYFNDFCKAHFGKTPGQMRKEKSSSEIPLSL